MVFLIRQNFRKIISYPTKLQKSFCYPTKLPIFTEKWKSMTKKPMINNISEMVMATQDKGKSAEMSAMMKAGLLRKIAHKVYTTNMEDTPEDIISATSFSFSASSILRRLLATGQLLHLSRRLKGISI